MTDDKSCARTDPHPSLALAAQVAGHDGALIEAFQNGVHAGQESAG